MRYRKIPREGDMLVYIDPLTIIMLVVLAWLGSAATERFVKKKRDTEEYLMYLRQALIYSGYTAEKVREIKIPHSPGFYPVVRRVLVEERPAYLAQRLGMYVQEILPHLKRADKNVVEEYQFVLAHFSEAYEIGSICHIEAATARVCALCCFVKTVYTQLALEQKMETYRALDSWVDETMEWLDTTQYLMPRIEPLLDE